MEPTKFDDLTKALATSTSRRQALRRIGGFLGGTALAGLFPGLALASNSACAHFCNAVFGAGTPAASQCTSDAAHHKGLCYTCGPSSPGGTKPICCPGNGSHCSSYSSATCCTSGQTCQSGQCVTPCTTNGGTCSGNGDCCSSNCSNGFCCASGQVGLSNGSCATPCSSPDESCSGPCGTGSCSPDASGAFYCGGHSEDGSCTTDSNCNKGYFCYFFDNVCVSLC